MLLSPFVDRASLRVFGSTARRSPRRIRTRGQLADRDGNIWVVENAFEQIARIDRTTGKFDDLGQRAISSG